MGKTFIVECDFCGEIITDNSIKINISFEEFDKNFSNNVTANDLWNPYLCSSCYKTAKEYLSVVCFGEKLEKKNLFNHIKNFKFEDVDCPEETEKEREKI